MVVDCEKAEVEIVVVLLIAFARPVEARCGLEYAEV